MSTTTLQAGAQSRAMTRDERRVIFASSLGTVFEWYDFYLYGSLAAIIAGHFFSGVNPTAGFIFALLAFAAGFAVRPFGALVFGALLVAVYAAYRWTRLSRTGLFWAAFILTRPLGAVVGDFLDKPLHDGGLALSRFTASLVLLAFIVAAVAVMPQRAARTKH